MTSYPTGPAWTSDQAQLSKKQVGYYRARLRNKVHQLVLKQYLKLEANGLSRAELARRIYKRPEIITRLLGAPGNWTLDTVSDLMLGMGYEPAISFVGLAEANAPQEAGLLPSLEEAKKHEGTTLSLASRPQVEIGVPLFVLGCYSESAATEPSEQRKTGTFG